MFGLRYQNQCFPLLPKNIIFGTQVLILFFQIIVFHLLSSMASDDNRQKGCTSPKMASKNVSFLANWSYCSSILLCSQLIHVIEEYMEEYNQIYTTKMKLVLFMDALAHICRITRILRQALGNALLLGVGGSGRQSLTKLASHM